MVDHRIHIAGADRKEQPRLAEFSPGVATLPVGLADDGHAIPGGLEHAPQNRHRKAGMIDVRIAGDEHDVDLVPAPFAHLLDTHRQRLRGTRMERFRGVCHRPQGGVVDDGEIHMENSVARRRGKIRKRRSGKADTLSESYPIDIVGFDSTDFTALSVYLPFSQNARCNGHSSAIRVSNRRDKHTNPSHTRRAVVCDHLPFSPGSGTNWSMSTSS